MLKCIKNYYCSYVFISIFISSLMVSAPPKSKSDSEGLENVKIWFKDDVSVGIEWSVKTSRTCRVTCKQLNGNVPPNVQTVKSKSVEIYGLSPNTQYVVTIEIVDGKTQSKHEIPFQTLPRGPWHSGYIAFKHLDEHSVEVTWRIHIIGVKYIVSYAPTANPKKLSNKVETGSESVVLTKLIPDTEYTINIIPINIRRKKEYEGRPTVFRTLQKVMPIRKYSITKSPFDPRRVKITWPLPCTDMEKYEVLYNSAREKFTRTTTSKSTYVDLINLEIDTEYTFTVVAIRTVKRYTYHKQKFKTFSLAEFFYTDRFKVLENYPPTNSKYGGVTSDPYFTLKVETINRLLIMSLTHKIEISRKTVVEDTFALLKQLKAAPLTLYKDLNVVFVGEKGRDVGGVKQEWITLFSTKVFNPEFKLFIYSDENSTNVEINPESGKTLNHLIQFQSIGLFTAMALLHECHLNVYFSLPLLTTILLRPINLDDVKIADPALYPGLLWTKNNDPRKLKPKLKFTAPESEEIKLIEKGDKTKVTKKNMDKYIRLLINWRFIGRVELQTAAFLKGFYSLIPLSDIRVFNEDQLQTLIGGSSKIDVEFWKSCTKYENCSERDNIVKWFWEAVEKFSPEMKEKLLEFVTATSRFAINGERKFKFIIRFYENAKDNRLPVAHTCFNRIDLPNYKSSKILHDKLIEAIQYKIFEFGLQK